MPTYEGLRLKILKIRREKLSTIRRKKLQISSFTIISNNCWGGMIYESYNLVKQSPTIGMFFFPSDYIKFISNLKFYIESPLKQISLDESKCQDHAAPIAALPVHHRHGGGSAEVEHHHRQRILRRCRGVRRQQVHPQGLRLFNGDLQPRRGSGTHHQGLQPRNASDGPGRFLRQPGHHRADDGPLRGVMARQHLPHGVLVGRKGQHLSRGDAALGYHPVPVVQQGKNNVGVSDIGGQQHKISSLIQRF